MRNTILNRALSLVVLSTFLLNDICFGLGVQPGSTQAPTKDAMYALGRKLIATKVGPGSIDWDKCPPGSFVGNGQVPGAEFINADYSNPPAGWANNPILQKTNLIDAFKYFRDNEAKIPPELLDIREGFFDVDAEKGELPISRLEASFEQGRMKYTLIVHTEFVQIWNHIRQNDVWYKPENSDRVRSVAWGIFYRVAKHEMTDLRKNGSGIKSAGHIGFSFGGLQIEEDEAAANGIKGQYSVTNDAIWMWFLASYAFANTTRYNNETLSERIKWLCLGDGRQYIKGEFPLTWDQSYATLGEKRVLKPMTDLACGINYHFFSTGRSVPEFEIDQTFVEEYMERAGKIVRNLYATGSGEQLNKDKVLAALQALKIDRKKETTLAELAKNTVLQAHEVRSVIILINKELPVKERFILLSGGEVIIPVAAKVRETAETKLVYGKNGGMGAVAIVGGELDGVYVEINPANGRAVVYKNKGGPALKPIDPARCNKAIELIKADLAARKAAAAAAKETPASPDASVSAPTVPSPMPQGGEKPGQRNVLGEVGSGSTDGRPVDRRTADWVTGREPASVPAQTMIIPKDLIWFLYQSHGMSQEEGESAIGMMAPIIDSAKVGGSEVILIAEYGGVAPESLKALLKTDDNQRVVRLLMNDEVARQLYDMTAIKAGQKHAKGLQEGRVYDERNKRLQAIARYAAANKIKVIPERPDFEAWRQSAILDMYRDIISLGFPQFDMYMELAKNEVQKTVEYEVEARDAAINTLVMETRAANPGAYIIVLRGTMHKDAHAGLAGKGYDIGVNIQPFAFDGLDAKQSVVYNWLEEGRREFSEQDLLDIARYGAVTVIYAVLRASGISGSESSDLANKISSRLKFAEIRLLAGKIEDMQLSSDELMRRIYSFATEHNIATAEEEIILRRAAGIIVRDDKNTAAVDPEKVTEFEDLIDRSFAANTASGISLKMIDRRYNAHNLPENVVVDSLERLGFLEKNGSWQRVSKRKANLPAAETRPGQRDVLGTTGHGDTTGKGPTRGEGDFIAGRKAPLDQAAQLRKLMADRKREQAPQLPPQSLLSQPDQAEKLRDAMRKRLAETEGGEGQPVIRIISEYIISLGLDKGPGAEKLSATELETIYKAVALLKDSKVELIIPQSLKFTSSMKRAIREIGKHEGKDAVELREYANMDRLVNMCKEKPAPGTRRMILVEDRDRADIAGIIERDQEIFKLARFLPISLPDDYEDFRKDDNVATVYQAKLTTAALLGALLENGKTPMPEALFREMVKETFAGDETALAAFINELGRPDEEVAAMDAIGLMNRVITRLLARPIKLVEKIGREIQLMKAFWTAA